MTGNFRSKPVIILKKKRKKKTHITSCGICCMLDDPALGWSELSPGCPSPGSLGQVLSSRGVSEKSSHSPALITAAVTLHLGFPADAGDNTPANAGEVRDSGSIPGSGRSPGTGHGNPLQYSCLENPLDRGAWWSTVHGVVRIRYD